jgi:HK97 family phage portal protein
MALVYIYRSAFKGGAPARVPLAQGMMAGWIPAFEGGFGPDGYDYARAVEEGFLANPIAQRSVRIVAEGVGQAPLTSNDARLAALVNATSAGQSLIETLAAHLLLHGNGYVQIIKDAAGVPVELFALRPERVSVVTGSDGWPCAYDYTVQGNRTRIPVLDEDGWPGIIPIRAMHPLDDHRGAGALEAAHQAVTIHNAAARWNRALLENSARPSGALASCAAGRRGRKARGNPRRRTAPAAGARCRGRSHGRRHPTACRCGPFPRR